MLFVSDISRYAPIQISNVPEDINLFELFTILSPDLVEHTKNCICDMIHIDVFLKKILINNKDIRPPPIITLLIMHKYKVEKPLFAHVN